MSRGVVRRVVVYMPTAVRKPVYSALCIFLEKLIKILVDDKIGEMPVIKPCTFERFVAYVETDRFYQMYFTARCRGGAHYVAGVLRYFRFYQNYIERHIQLHCLISE